MSGRLAQCVLADHMSHVRGRYLLSGVCSVLFYWLPLALIGCSIALQDVCCDA